jgi:hypothetical protein
MKRTETAVRERWNLYGTTEKGGANDLGTIFRPVMPGAPFNEPRALECVCDRLVALD